MSNKDRNPRAAKAQASSGQHKTHHTVKTAAGPGPSAAQQTAKPAAGPSPSATQQTAKPSAATPEELKGQIQSLADVVYRLALQVNLLSERHRSLEKSLGARVAPRTGEPKAGESSGQAKPPEAELPGLH